MEPPRQLGRLNKSDNKIPEMDFNGKLLIADLSLNQVKSVEEYELLVVSPSCSLAWVPYKVGDPLPDGAQQTGILNGVAVYSMLVPIREWRFERFGFYVVGDIVGHYIWSGEIIGTLDMYILALV